MWVERDQTIGEREMRGLGEALDDVKKGKRQVVRVKEATHLEAHCIWLSSSYFFKIVS